MAMNSKEQPRQTLEQLRAQDAWNCANRACQQLGKDYDRYVNLAKSVPALIMNSGMMQVMAFLYEKSLDKKTGRLKPNDPHTLVGDQLRAALHARFSEIPYNFEGCMNHLFTIHDPQRYQAITAEAFAWLKWLRQMAAARQS